ncbi:DEAD/DEAH box helicase family protein [Ruminococcus sp. FMB-CY1]|uniref:EcoAI/FtnUII family type I restriction enzme subunit R n=1 Tax=unclassified Ruminococcus TaxID=2608920 RepID=UPI00208EA41A|nr:MULTISPECIES: DEAD/DEAH box helicase family protein [unclassified Ruminococcus]USP68852.1 DEAD/DEAH box helicase family protein [Ruminococcus sp. FMBCY1]WBX57845.1 DEAD/DEAH box helicase family protein [Ruminococcus sp. FMB-CY1]
MILDKKQMTEEDIKLQYITPAVQAKWGLDRITMETKITDGRINLKGNIVTREKPKKADYVLYLTKNKPIAIVEAKDNNHFISYGLQQAITYAKMQDIPFAYSSNGDGFQEHDLLTGLERTLPMDEFPTVDELTARWESETNGGKGISDNERKIINQPYYSSQNTYDPRYYQRNAINRTVEAIANGQERLLLVMATGTGKTYTAFQIVYRLLKSRLKKKVLYLADRNILVDQSIQQDFSPLEKVIHKINFAKDDPVTITSHEVYFSLYQQLAGNEENEDEESGEETVARFAKLFNQDFFDLIIVDECHRGSAKKDSNWRKILDYFFSATQIGMTATPKETKYISNIDYFGEPVYTYSLREGIEDGFLAPFRVINITTDISDGWRPYKGQLDKFGNEIEDRIYTNSDFDYNIILEDRTYEVAREITEYLKSTDRMQKTIVFCATEDHAERMRIALNNLNADMVKENPDYVVRITGSDTYGKSKLDYFISVSAPYPVIATTSKLLSTGADCKMTKLIVLDEMINSMTEFKQIIGRGTRLREKEGKNHFVVMDFRNVTRLFSDPDWDGPIEIVEGFDPNHKPTPKPDTPGNGSDSVSPPPTVDKYVVDENGCDVHIIGKRVEVYDALGKLLRQESIVDYTKSNILGKYASLDNFISKWTSEEKKEAIRGLLKEQGIDLEQMKAEQGMTDVDDFDFICHVAFNQKPLTRKERANNVKKRDFLSKYSGVAREVLEALLDKYMNTGIYEIEKTEILQLDPFKKFGKPSKIATYFGGKAGYIQAVKALEEELYKAG